ncbi:MAG: tetratricopeptide repeat protein, partial [Pseudomonadota bacterium]
MIDLATLRFQEERAVLAPTRESSSNLESLDLINRAIEEDPDNARAHVVQSDIYAWMGIPIAAIRSLNRANTIDPGDMGITVRLAELHFRAREYDEVEKIVRLSPLADSDDVDLLSIRAAALREAGNDGDALEIYNSLLERGKPSAMAYLIRADVAASNGDIHTARKNYTEAFNYFGAGYQNFGLGIGTRGYPGLRSLLPAEESSLQEAHDLCRALEESPNSARIVLRLADVLA